MKEIKIIFIVCVCGGGGGKGEVLTYEYPRNIIHVHKKIMLKQFAQ
jgi:hypothetical protein